MLSRTNRLRHENDFRRVFRTSKSFKKDGIVFLYTSSPAAPTVHPRFGVVVSKKYSLSAVARNKVRRRIRSVLKELLPSVNKKFDGVLMVQRKLSSVTYPELRKNIEWLLEKTNLLSKK